MPCFGRGVKGAVQIPDNYQAFVTMREQGLNTVPVALRSIPILGPFGNVARAWGANLQEGLRVAVLAAERGGKIRQVSRVLTS